MIRPADIVFHLQANLPAHTDLFSDEIIGTGVVSGGVVTVTTAGAHNLPVGRSFVVASGDFQNPITAIVLNPDETTRFTTQFDHDLTAPQLPNDPQNLVLTGIAAPWSGTFKTDSVPNRRTFEIETPAGETVAPAVEGHLIETRPAGLAGIQTVETVPSTTTFTFTAPSNLPSLPDGQIDNLRILRGSRVTGAADLDRAEAQYTEKAAGQAALYVVMTDVDISKDRHTHNDGVATFTPQNFGKLTALQNFVTVVILPTAADDKTGFKAQSLAYDQVFRALTRSLLGLRPPDAETKMNYVTVPNGHGPSRQNTAYYVHEFAWQLPAVLGLDDGIQQSPDVAFRDISSTWDVNSDDMAQLEANVDLDDEPLV